MNALIFLDQILFGFCLNDISKVTIMTSIFFYLYDILQMYFNLINQNQKLHRFPRKKIIVEWFKIGTLF